MQGLVNNLRQKRWVNLAIVNLRILLGFAFVPSGLKKVLNQPFTDPNNVGAFHDFLHAFHATGLFYQFVGAVQLTVAALLMTQTFATLGALIALPVFVTIAAFCWSTATLFTSVMVTCMLTGTAVLALWDLHTWRSVVQPGRSPAVPPVPPHDITKLIDIVLWRRCGAAILALYFTICAASGGIYRPRGVELSNPAFYVLPLIAVFPFATFAVEQLTRRRRRRRRTAAANGVV